MVLIAGSVAITYHDKDWEEDNSDDGAREPDPENVKVRLWKQMRGLLWKF